MSSSLSTPTVGSVLIASSNVDAMKDWYRKAFEVDEFETGAFQLGPVGIFIEAHNEVEGPTREPARVTINLNVDDCRALEDHLRWIDVVWVRPVERESFGLIGTIADPDGNYVQIIHRGCSRRAACLTTEPPKRWTNPHPNPGPIIDRCARSRTPTSQP